MTLEVARVEADVASGTFLVNNFPANILFDSKFDYSFILHKFGRRIVLPIDEIDSALVVEVASGKFVLVSDCIRNIIIELNSYKFHEELLPIELNGFDIVLGMDWLNANDVDIKCRKKIMVIKPSGSEPFMVYRDKHRVNFGIISLMKAGKCKSSQKS
ncbi:uncharacterized protein LOC111920974 [Lactuca sativa]|uniref:uncharacterized protein LOC111920974 n=1 Tax=Lactuca sativa TaxID=4236 RepID=UPI000CD80CF9|nr:uncharacterized protein LOC111920974 [Lactuca sativa]